MKATSVPKVIAEARMRQPPAQTIAASVIDPTNSASAENIESKRTLVNCAWR